MKEYFTTIPANVVDILLPIIRFIYDPLPYLYVQVMNQILSSVVHPRYRHVDVYRCVTVTWTQPRRLTAPWRGQNPC